MDALSQQAVGKKVGQNAFIHIILTKSRIVRLSTVTSADISSISPLYRLLGLEVSIDNLSSSVLVRPGYNPPSQIAQLLRYHDLCL